MVYRQIYEGLEIGKQFYIIILYFWSLGEVMIYDGQLRRERRSGPSRIPGKLNFRNPGNRRDKIFWILNFRNPVGAPATRQPPRQIFWIRNSRRRHNSGDM